MAATDHLHRRIAKMSERIRQLEDALSILHSASPQSSSANGEVHPLLREELLSVKAHKPDEPPPVSELEMMAGREDGENQGGSGIIDAFGSLSISEGGASRFFGAAGGVEVSSHYCLISS